MGMGAASLALLKNTGKGAAPAEEEPEVEETQAEETSADDAGDEEQVIEVTKEDILKMPAAELETLVTELGGELPSDWKKMSLAKKRDWVLTTFDDGEVEEEQEEVEETKPAPEPEKPAPKATAKASTKKADPKPAPAPKTEVPIEAKATVPAKAEAKKPAAKGKSKSEGKVEIIAPSAVTALVQQIENMDQATARSLVGQLANEAEFTFFKLGGVLAAIQSNSWFTPYTSFKDYVEMEVGVDYRRACYWTRIYNDITESGIDYAKVSHLGWTKLKELSSILTKDNLDEWLEAIEGKTTLQIIAMVSAANKKPDQITGEVKEVTTMTFKVHTDQKETIRTAIDDAKGKLGSEVDTVALEHICMDYLSGGNTDLKALLEKVGIDKAIEAFNEAFPDQQLSLT